MAILAFDTSNYTTSVALLTQEEAYSQEKLLSVPQGALGLRQQEALFQHIKALPLLLDSLKAQCPSAFDSITGIAVSTKPRETEDSYMPCFLAGWQFAQGLATVLSLPCYEVSHQQGHFAAALWNLGKESLLEETFLCWHISGGTTELLEVSCQDGLPVAQLLGGSQDISAGQLIDRCGKALALPFPSGKQVDAYACDYQATMRPFPVKETNLQFSLSGMENKVQGLLAEGKSPCEISAFVLETLAYILKKVTENAQNGRALPVLFCGGVASSRYLKQKLPEYLFPSAYARDNAMGVAVLGRRREADS